MSRFVGVYNSSDIDSAMDSFSLEGKDKAEE